MVQLAPDDVRKLRTMYTWFASNRHTAQLPNQPIKAWPRGGRTQPDWVTIKVKNITAGTMVQWSPVHVEGLVNFNDPSGSSITDVPPGMLHPDRTFDADWGYVRQNGPYAFNQEMMNDNLFHAVITKDLAPQEVGVAVVKGAVPGVLRLNSQSTNQRALVYSHLVPQRPPYTGMPNGIRRGWSFENPNSLTGVNTIGTPNVSVCRDIWRSGGNEWWGFIDLNHSRPGRAFTSRRDVLGNPWLISITSSGGLTPNYGSSGLPSYQTWIDWAFAQGFPANSIWESTKATQQGGAAPPWGIVFKRHCEVTISGGFIWTPGPRSGQLHSTSPYLYAIDGQKIEIYLEAWSTVSPSMLSSTLVATYTAGPHLSHLPNLAHPAGSKCCDFHHTMLVSPTGANFTIPTMLRVKVKLLNESGGTSGFTGNSTFAHPWSDIVIDNFSAYTIQKDGIVYHPPEEDGTAPGGPGGPIQPL